MNKVSAIILVAFTLFSCKEKDDSYSIVYEIFEDFTVRYIDVDTDISDLSWLEYESFSFDSATLGTSHVILSSGKIYTVDNQLKSIREHDFETFEVIREFAHSGRGPGEYIDIGAVFSVENSISTFDRSQSKIITYDSGFKFVNEMIISGMLQTDSFIKSDSMIVYHTRANEHKLFGKLSLKDTSSIYFHNYTISQGYQPRGYNNSKIHYDNNQLIIASENMPIVFIYENNLTGFQPRSILRLRSSSLEMINKPMSFDGGFGSSLIENPPLEIISNTNGNIVGLSPVFQRVRTSNSYLILQELQDRSLIIIKSENSEYSHLGNYRFFNESNMQINSSDFQIALPYVYVGVFDENKILRFKIADLNS
ncbi:MAG: hypothetical protein LAT57_07940 [Balneolales bacterium]|nr:hypothetical protein [Balneolales bacterium]